VAVNPFDIVNPGTVDIDKGPIRAIISGPVRADLLLVGSEVTTNAQNDMLRNYGIIPIQVNDISWTE
jgi:Ni,Fe-hydrogenase III small subunit